MGSVTEAGIGRFCIDIFMQYLTKKYPDRDPRPARQKFFFILW